MIKLKKILIILFLSILFFNKSFAASENNIYQKIDLFGEVLDKINKEYVEEINQNEAMDAAINGVLQSLDPYSAYMSPEMFENMQTETSGEFGGLGIEVSMEAGVVKVISPIDSSPADRAGVKAGGRTGMTSLVIGILFLACLFLSPLATSLPKEIDGAALLYVAVLFVRNITDIEWDDIAESAPAVLAMIAMPLTYSISNGIALAFISYALIKIFTGKFSTTSPAIWVIAILSFLSFVVA